MTTDREKFLCVLAGGPIMPPQAIILLAGEDAMPRLEKAVGRFLELRQWAIAKDLRKYKPVIVITGGKHDGDRWWGAEELTPKMIGKGVSHSRILIENTAQNTREQAEKVIDVAMERGWERLMVVASAYHTPRAFLTFLKVLQERGLTEEIELLPDSADQSPWFAPPAGMDTLRIDLLDVEIEKMEKYDIASYTEGLDYLAYWELYVPDMGEGK